MLLPTFVTVDKSRSRSEARNILPPTPRYITMSLPDNYYLFGRKPLQYAVIGIGVNCNNTLEDFPPELRDVATSLYLETGKRVQRAALAAALIEELDKLYAALQSGDTASYLTSYRRDCLTLGREVQLLWQNVKEKVTALDVDDQFGLVVRRADGTVETIRTGEVSVRGLYGYVE